MLVEMQYFQYLLHQSQFLMSLHLLCPHFSCTVFLLVDEFTLKVKCVYGCDQYSTMAHISMSETFSPLVGSCTCRERNIFGRHCTYYVDVSIV